MRKSYLFRFFMVLAALAVGGLMATPPARAHKVQVFAWMEGGRVMVDAFYSKSRKVQGGRIQVLDPESGRILLEGVTTEEGLFSFDPPQKTGLKIVLEAGMGHQADWTLSAADLASASNPVAAPASPPAATSNPAPAANPVPASTSNSSSPASGASANAGCSIRPEDLQRLVAEAVAREVGPLTRSIAELRQAQDEPSLARILSGLGWIMGILGLVLILKRPRTRV